MRHECIQSSVNSGSVPDENRFLRGGGEQQEMNHQLTFALSFKDKL